MSGSTLQDAKQSSAPTAEIDLDWLTLEDGESIQWANTPHKHSLVPAFVLGIPLSLVLIGIPLFVGSYLQYINMNYVVTNRGLYSKRGILSRDAVVIAIAAVTFGASLRYLLVGEDAHPEPGYELIELEPVIDSDDDPAPTDDLAKARRQEWQEKADRLADSQQTNHRCRRCPHPERDR